MLGTLFTNDILYTELNIKGLIRYRKLSLNNKIESIIGTFIC